MARQVICSNNIICRSLTSKLTTFSLVHQWQECCGVIHTVHTLCINVNQTSIWYLFTTTQSNLVTDLFSITRTQRKTVDNTCYHKLSVGKYNFRQLLLTAALSTQKQIRTNKITFLFERKRVHLCMKVCVCESTFEYILMGVHVCACICGSACVYG